MFLFPCGYVDDERENYEQYCNDKINYQTAMTSAQVPFAIVS